MRALSTSDDTDYLPHLWLLCAAVSAAFLALVAAAAFSNDPDVSPILWPTLGALAFGLVAVVLAPGRESS
jgi:hypothetical protein